MADATPSRRRRTIGFLMTAIALLGIPLYLAVPVVRVGGIPHHMTFLQTARWVAIDRDNTCTRCHGGTTQRAFRIPINPSPGPEIRSLSTYRSADTTPKPGHSITD